MPSPRCRTIIQKDGIKLVFANHDDYLKKKHSFMYDEVHDSWELAPAYDLTYSLNPELNIKTRSRALSINGKRTGIDMNDFSTIAEKYTLENFKKNVAEVQDTIAYRKKYCPRGWHSSTNY